MLKLVYYLDVLSSWCFYSEPNLRRLLDRYGDRIQYEWRIALITEGMPMGHTREQMDWFYRRSGSISGTHLNSAWNQGPYNTLQPNLAAEAARELGFSDDRVRLALARAALLDGKSIVQREVSLQVVSAVTGVDARKVERMIDDERMLENIQRSSAEFEALGIDQRPAFTLRSDIGDRAIFSGLWTYDPLQATVAAMLSDEEKYERFARENPPFPAGA